MVSDGIECWPVITPASARLSPTWPLALQDDQKYHILHFAPDLIVKLCNPSGIKWKPRLWAVSWHAGVRWGYRPVDCRLSHISSIFPPFLLCAVKTWTGLEQQLLSLLSLASQNTEYSHNNSHSSHSSVWAADPRRRPAPASKTVKILCGQHSRGTGAVRRVTDGKQKDSS